MRNQLLLYSSGCVCGWMEKESLQEMSRILKVILYQTAECLAHSQWELRRIANQVTSHKLLLCRLLKTRFHLIGNIDLNSHSSQLAHRFPENCLHSKYVSIYAAMPD